MDGIGSAAQSGAATPAAAKSAAVSALRSSSCIPRLPCLMIACHALFVLRTHEFRAESALVENFAGHRVFDFDQTHAAKCETRSMAQRRLGVRQRHTRFKPKPRAWRRIDNKGHAI